MIIVCPTYNNTSNNDSDNFSLALNLNRNYHNELRNDLIPAVESKYSTFAKDTTPEEIKNSREHRGFGGFSIGSVATWRTFQNCLDYFKYFMPMSCGTSLDDDNIWSAAENYEQNDYFVFTMTGTDDFAYSYVNQRVQNWYPISLFDLHIGRRKSSIFSLVILSVKINLNILNLPKLRFCVASLRICFLYYTSSNIKCKGGATHVLHPNPRKLLRRPYRHDHDRQPIHSRKN